MDKQRKFVYSTGSNSKKPKSSSDPFSWTTNPMNNEAGACKMPKDDTDVFELDFDDDDITSTMSEADFDRLELEASKKLGLHQPSAINVSSSSESRREVKDPASLVETNFRETGPSFVNERSPNEESGSNSMEGCQSRGTNSGPSTVQLQQLSEQLEQYKSKVRQLESSLCEKDGELKILRSSLDKNRLENAEKSERIIQLKNKQNAEQSQREASLAKEVACLKTRISFQEQELMEQCKRLQSQTKPPSVTGAVKRKAGIEALNTSFDMENSFIATQASSVKKMPRISEKTGVVKTEPTLNKAASPVKRENIVKSVKPCNVPQVKKEFVYSSESKGFKLVKKLILTHSNDDICDSDQDMTDSISLLNLLKYPLKNLPEVLKAHLVNIGTDEPSPFHLWQSQKLHISPVDQNSGDVEVLDLDSGKFGLVIQGIFILLGTNERTLSSGTHVSQKEVSPSLGVTHILVFLELYISSYLFTRQNAANDSIDDNNLGQSCRESQKNDNEWEKAFIDDQEMILQSLQILKLLIYSCPSLVKLILERTNPSMFSCDDDQEVIIIDDLDEKPEEVKIAAGSGASCRRIPRCSDACSTQERPEQSNLSAAEDEAEEVAMGSFLSLLLQNLEKLIIPHSQGESLTVSYAALDVLIAMTSVCEKTELERIFLLLKRGCLLALLAKDSGSFTILPVMTLLKNLLPCKDIHKMLCSKTDDCILLKIYQCACEEEEEEVSNALWSHFLLQVVKFIKSVAFSNSDSIEFLLETDCQCSLEIIRCLVLLLHDKVNYLSGLDSDIVISDESLTILRIGITLLVLLCTHSSYSVDHKLDVEHHYIELIYKVMILYKNIKDFIPEVEALGVQDLLDMEQIDEIEWSMGSDDEDDECMEIDDG